MDFISLHYDYNTRDTNSFLHKFCKCLYPQHCLITTSQEKWRKEKKTFHIKKFISDKNKACLAFLLDPC